MATVHNRCIMPHFLRIISAPLGVPFPIAMVYNIPSLKLLTEGQQGNLCAQICTTAYVIVPMHSGASVHGPMKGLVFVGFFRGLKTPRRCCAYGVGLPKMV